MLNERPVLTRSIDPEIFCTFYWLKEELMHFCRDNDLPATGSKDELTQRIAHYLRTGEVLEPKKIVRSHNTPVKITPDTRIEEDLRCSQVHRAFFKAYIGRGFVFNTRFQKWLKANAGKTYAEAIDAYAAIRAEAGEGRKNIDAQFEYNTYIRDFFEDKPRGTIEEAISCWKYKRTLPGPHKFEHKDREMVRLETK